MSTKRISSDWVALIFIAALGAIQVYFYDITFHGPDQIRDVEVARRLLHHHEWPVNGPPLFGERFSLPPGFYYLLALPLLIRDTEAAIFIAFGALFALSVLYLWYVVRTHWGTRCALAYAMLAFPIFASIYAHSAWNPALVMTFSNVTLGLFISLVYQKRHDALMLLFVFFLLVQIHPSGAPLLLGISVYALLNYRTILNPKTQVAVFVVTGLTAVWASNSQLISRLKEPMRTVLGPTSGNHWLSNLLDVEKWRDVLLMPYSAIDSIQPNISGLTTLAALHLALMLAGALLGTTHAVRERAIRWVFITTLLWFIVSMTFLSQGAFWHLDVIHPWLAVLAAFGLARTSEKAQWSAGRFNVVASAALTLVVIAHLALYVQFEKKGKYDLMTASLFFPKLEPLEDRVPGYTFKYLDAMRDSLSNLGACQDQIIGLDTLVMGNVTNRTLDIPCTPQSTTAQVFETLYFIAPQQDALQFEFTKSLPPIATVAASEIYAVKNTGMLINQRANNVLLSGEKVNYMTYLPARLETGLHISLPPATETIVRVALRCGKDYPVEQQTHWKVQGADYKKPLTAVHARYLGTVYYDLEWILTMPASQKYGATISSALDRLDCDVSAIARPAVM